MVLDQASSRHRVMPIGRGARTLLFELDSSIRELTRWYALAAAQGHFRAMNLLARCQERGWGC
jgi:predicted 2-oxoglutarate/Fe(II)-dependent dioxygenase YbiX